MAKNTWLEKGKRTITAVLPVSENRMGSCNRCGECCKLPNVCPFLDYDKDGYSICKIYNFRPLNCRKYPRTEDEKVCANCGYFFVTEEEKVLVK